MKKTEADGPVVALISITDQTQRQTSIGRYVFFALPFVMISIGIFAGSAAMQWAGFILAFVAILALLAKTHISAKPLTFDEARQRIDEIEEKAKAWNSKS